MAVTFRDRCLAGIGRAGLNRSALFICKIFLLDDMLKCQAFQEMV